MVWCSDEYHVQFKSHIYDQFGRNAFGCSGSCGRKLVLMDNEAGPDANGQVLIIESQVGGRRCPNDINMVSKGF